MKKIVLVLLAVVSLGGCSGIMTASQLRDTYGPPGSIEHVGDIQIWYYCRSYVKGQYCYEYHFDHSGNLIKKNEYWRMEAPTNKILEKSLVAKGTGWPIVLGYAVTNNHVVEGHGKITLICSDGKKISATVLLADRWNDIALLKVANPKELPPALPIAVSKAGIGTKVFTMGYPHADILGSKPKLTDGLISSMTGVQDDPRTYQITVPLQAGNSGGPLLNLSGEVVGIVTYKLDAIKVFKWTGDLPQNVNYAVKISYLKPLIDSVAADNYHINELSKESGNLEELSKRIQGSIMIVVAE